MPSDNYTEKKALHAGEPINLAIYQYCLDVLYIQGV